MPAGEQVKTRWLYLVSILVASCALASPHALAQGPEQTSEPKVRQTANDAATGEVEESRNGSGVGANASAPSAVLDGRDDELSPSRESSGAIPPLQGNVTRTAPGSFNTPGFLGPANLPPQNQNFQNQFPLNQYPQYSPNQFQAPLGQPVPYPHYPQGYVMPNNFNAPNGFSPQGLTPPYQPSFAPPQMPPNNLQPGTPQADKSSEPPKGGLFGSALKSILNGAINQNNAPPAERPWWIPGNAFTNDSMVAPYYAMDIFWWDKRPIPNKPQMVRLSTSVSRFWRGYVAEPCFVLVEPDPRAPGNFTFQSRQPNGPRGWLQALDKPDPSGFPQYRYWLDQ